MSVSLEQVFVLPGAHSPRMLTGLMHISISSLPLGADILG